MKKILAVLLALAIGLIPTLAMAEDAEIASDNWIEAALNAGRSVITEVTWNAPEVLKDFKAVCKEQKTDGERVDISVFKGETDLLGLTAGVSNSADALYLQAKPLGEAPIAFTSGDLTLLLEQLLDMLAASGVLSEAAVDAEIEALGDSAVEALVPMFDPSDLNLTPLLMAVPYLKDCVRVTDVEDYDVELSYYSAERDEEGKLKILEKNLPVTAAELPQPAQVKTEVTVTLTADDLQIIVNALCATVMANPSLAMLLEDYLGVITEMMENFISDMAEDLVFQVGMNEDGEPVFVSMTLAMKQGLKSRSYAFGAVIAEDPETETGLISMNGMYSDDREEAYHYLFDMMLVVSGAENNITFLTTLGDVDEDFLSAVATVSMQQPSENERTANAVIALVGDLDGEELNMEVDVNGEGVRNGDDFTIDTDSKSADMTSGETITSVSLHQTTGDPEPKVNLGSAIYPAQMDEEGLNQFFNDLLNNIMAWANDVVAVLEPAAEETVEQVSGNNA